MEKARDKYRLGHALPDSRQLHPAFNLLAVRYREPTTSILAIIQLVLLWTKTTYCGDVSSREDQCSLAFLNVVHQRY